MIRRAAAVGVLSGVATAVATAALSGLVRCIDSPVFYYPLAVLWASLGVTAFTIGGAMASAPSGRRVAIPVLTIGAILLATALIGPPYRTCSQFFVPR